MDARNLFSQEHGLFRETARRFIEAEIAPHHALFDGWGDMWECPIARAYADAHIVKIAGGSMEVMKQIIDRSFF